MNDIKVMDTIKEMKEENAIKVCKEINDYFFHRSTFLSLVLHIKLIALQYA